MPGEQSVVLIERQDISLDGLIYRSCPSDKNKQTSKQ